MSRIGFGTILFQMGGGSKHVGEEFYGRKILSAEMKDNRLTLRLAGDPADSIHIQDDGQSCCEERYMSTDDDIQSLVGHNLTRIEAKEAPDIEGDYDTHECVFVEIGTDSGFVTLVNHNIHNGYYGGFGLNILKNEEAY